MHTCTTASVESDERAKVGARGPVAAMADENFAPKTGASLLWIGTATNINEQH